MTCIPKTKIPALVCMAAFWMMAAVVGHAQQPCRDTLVYVYDTICEGETYDFNGRELSYTGLFFDTVQRAGSDCDSIIILRLSVLMIPDANIYPYRRCRGNVGFDLYNSGMGNYYQWSSSPADTSLIGHENDPWVHVNPQQPVTYYLRVGYSSNFRCSDTGSKTIYPIAPVTGGMSVYPDEITLNRMQFTVEDVSTGTREYQWDGWCGRHWTINGVRRTENNECVTFSAEPWWPDTVVVEMLAYTPTCLDTVVKRIPFKKIALYFPNVFTPEKEDNALFLPRVIGVTDFEMWIFDRRGTLLFHTLTADTPWDGTYQGSPCPSGSYVYRCRYRDIYTPDGDQSLMGTVTIIR